MKLQFIGAAQQVTGSMHYLQSTNGLRILIDCGLDYEEEDNYHTNAYFPFEASEIDVVLLTHAHIDHSGNLPTLFSQGFNGQVICTEPTAALVKPLLNDSVSIQNKRIKKRKASKKLYGFEWVKKTMENVLTLPFNKPFQLSPNLQVEYFAAGHILGAASIKITETKQNVSYSIGFTGDLGQQTNELIGGWERMGHLDALVMEGTYGNRVHEAKSIPEVALYEHIEETCHQKRGKLVIPAFSVGRTQSILYTLKNLSLQGKLDGIRVFTDSPLGKTSTMVHDQFRHYLLPEVSEDVALEDELFGFKELYVVEDKYDEEQMNRNYGPTIIVSSAGMAEGGRIQHHISSAIENPFAKVLIAGFCAEGTLGARLLKKQKHVQIGSRLRPVFAEIDKTDVYSAHPDQKELLEYASGYDDQKLKHIFLVHGEKSALEVLKNELGKTVRSKVFIPESEETFNL